MNDLCSGCGRPPHAGGCKVGPNTETENAALKSYTQRVQPKCGICMHPDHETPDCPKATSPRVAEALPGATTALHARIAELEAVLRESGEHALKAGCSGYLGSDFFARIAAATPDRVAETTASSGAPNPVEPGSIPGRPATDLERCKICGRWERKAHVPIPGNQKDVCWRELAHQAPDIAACYRLGYDHEKARAEAAEAKAESHRLGYVEALERARQHQARAEAAEATAKEERAMSQRYFDRVADAESARDGAKDALRESQEALAAAQLEAQALRKLLWLRHGCSPSGLYGDDGEMQCGSPGCILDFKRQSPEEIEARWLAVARAALGSNADEVRPCNLDLDSCPGGSHCPHYTGTSEP